MKKSPSQIVQRRAYAKALFAVTVWGASFVATKLAVAEIPPMAVVWLRFGIGTLVIGFVLVARREKATVAPRELPFLLLLGFLGITFHQWLQANGLVTASATSSSWIVSTIPVFTAVLGVIVLRERLHVAGWAGIVFAALGVLVVVSKGDLPALLRGAGGTSGDLLVLLSAPNWAVFSVLSRRALLTRPAISMLFIVMLIGWLLSTPLFLAEGGIASFTRLSTQGWMAMLFLGVFCSGVAFIFFYDALKEIPAARVSSLIYIEPFVTVVVAAVILTEPLLLSMFLGGAMILGGVWMVNRPRNW